MTTQIVIDRSAFRLTVFDRGRRRTSYPIGIGARGTPTPGGRYTINERFRVPASSPFYGPFAIGITAFTPKRLTDWPGGGIVGIHGTNQPALIPGRISKGCIRLNNRNVTRLIELAPLGTPVWIR